MEEGCALMLQLEADKGCILSLVQRQMDRIAPNLSAAVGTEIAAQLMGVAGGLVNLSKMPACNVQVRAAALPPCVGGRRSGWWWRDRACGGSATTRSVDLHISALLTNVPPPPPPPTPPPTHTHPLTAPPLTQVLGAKRKNLAGFSSTAAQPHQGFIFASDIVQQTPPSLRNKAARLVGAKCTLLARVDAYGQVRA